ncbi:unnamed protein product [Ilex paraguariensis]|uniref:GrpE protein homolog n=1 Tax=Ilex paraguariensis TaxID=185542 RepID=A0ABC8UIF7_9AQUA
MATAVPRILTFAAPSARFTTTTPTVKPHEFLCVSFTQRLRRTCSKRCRIPYFPNSSSERSPHLHNVLLAFASHGETTETETEEIEQEVQASELQDNSDGVSAVESGESEADSVDAEESASAILASLQSYKEALAINDEPKVAEIEAFLKSLEDEKIDLERKVDTMFEELSSEKERILRISADFDNFRKRTERERLLLVTNAQGEVVENLLPVLDNFERAKSQIKVETEGEEKINNSYQSIYKQFVEILGSLGVVPVETVGNAFDPMYAFDIVAYCCPFYVAGIIILLFDLWFNAGIAEALLTLSSRQPVWRRETEWMIEIKESRSSWLGLYWSVNSKLAQNSVEYLMNSIKCCIKHVQLHEAIMREDSTEFEEGIIIQEFRKGFKLGDRLLRPSMVKVSAGPGPAKAESSGPSEEPEGINETGEDSREPGSTQE